MSTQPTTIYQHPAARQQLMHRPTMQIANMEISLPEVGKIKIGRKGQPMSTQKGGTFQPPVKLRHFLITTMERDADGNYKIDAEAHKELGAEPTRVPIVMLYDDPGLDFMSRFVAYWGKRPWCAGNGMTATRLVAPQNKANNERKERQCPCPNLGEEYVPSQQTGPKCKWNGRLQVMLRVGGRVGGVWIFRTTSKHSVRGITSSMELIRSITGGRLAGIPLALALTPRTVQSPDGRQQTIYTVNVEFDGEIEQLREIGLAKMLEEKRVDVQRERLEEIAARSLQLTYLGSDEEAEAEDIAAEFAPEEAAADAGLTIAAEETGPQQAQAGQQAQTGDDLDQLGAGPTFGYEDTPAAQQQAEPKGKGGKGAGKKAAAEPEPERAAEDSTEAQQAGLVPVWLSAELSEQVEPGKMFTVLLDAMRKSADAEERNDLYAENHALIEQHLTPDQKRELSDAMSSDGGDQTAFDV